MDNYSYISENYHTISEKISALSAAAGHSVTLVAVTKSGSDDELVALARAGMLEIGENRPTELRRRADILYTEGYAPRLHEIGNLQRNKVKLIARDVALIHSLDTYELALEINKHALKLGRVIPVLIEINSAREEQKGGIDPERAEEFLISLGDMQGIAVAGLMTMGPVCCDPETLRPYFRETKQLFDRLNAKYGFALGGILSMGMSDSYEVAIEEGSTLVRIGRAFFRK